MPFDAQVSHRLQQALAPMLSQRWHRATFISDEAGALYYHIGTAASLRATGASVSAGDEADESLYITGLERGLLLGVIFADGVDIEDVRRFVTPILPQINSGVGG